MGISVVGSGGGGAMEESLEVQRRKELNQMKKKYGLRVGRREGGREGEREGGRVSGDIHVVTEIFIVEGFIW